MKGEGLFSMFQLIKSGFSLVACFIQSAATVTDYLSNWCNCNCKFSLSQFSKVQSVTVFLQFKWLNFWITNAVSKSVLMLPSSFLETGFSEQALSSFKYTSTFSQTDVIMSLTSPRGLIVTENRFETIGIKTRTSMQQEGMWRSWQYWDLLNR